MSAPESGSGIVSEFSSEFNSQRIFDPGTLTWNAQGLIPAICQDDASGEVLMLAWMNSEALAATLESGQVHFWSRSRRELWHKGATSGNTLHLRRIQVDCDADALLVIVRPAGPACHTGRRSCFYRSLV